MSSSCAAMMSHPLMHASTVDAFLFWGLAVSCSV